MACQHLLHVIYEEINKHEEGKQVIHAVFTPGEGGTHMECEVKASSMAVFQLTMQLIKTLAKNDEDGVPGVLTKLLLELSMQGGEDE